MQMQQIVNQSYDTLLAQANRTRVLLLHPKSKYRSLLLAKLLNDDRITTIYYAMGADDNSLKTFIDNLTHDVPNQHATFGRHLNMVAAAAYENLEDNLDTILQAFVREVQELGANKPLLFVIDEYDRSDEADDVHQFIEALAEVLPAHVHLVLNGRSLPRLPWVAMIAKRQALLVQDDQLITRNFYENTSTGQNERLKVFALGQGYVELDNKPIASWEGHLPRLLFFFTLDRPVVTRSEICQAFWPNLELDQAVNVFHVTKRRLHKALNLDVLVHNETHYQVNPEVSVYYDVLHFVEILMQGRDETNSDRFGAWQRAAELYRGPFLAGHSEPWIEQRRIAFRMGYLEAVTEMAQVHEGRNDKEGALRLYQQAVEEDVAREEIHRRIMRIYADLGRRSEAVAHYQQIEKSFAQHNLKLSGDTTKLYNELKA
jgi:two-component SAPR family response regulator